MGNWDSERMRLLLASAAGQWSAEWTIFWLHSLHTSSEEGAKQNSTTLEKGRIQCGNPGKMESSELKITRRVAVLGNSIIL